MVQTLGFIGSGNIGGTVARFAVAAGMNVVLSNSRGPDTLAGLVAELGPNARAATPEEAAHSGDLVVVSIPLKAYQGLPAAALAGKIVIDTINYYSERDSRVAELDSAELTSSQLVQRHLSGSRTVKAFNNIDAYRLTRLARPSGAPDRTALPIAGDDAAAKQQATALLDTFGYDAVDIGSLADSWRSEPDTPVYLWPYLPPKPEGLSQEEWQRWFAENPGVRVPADKVKELTDAAVRNPAGGSMSAFSN